MVRVYIIIASLFFTQVSAQTTPGKVEKQAKDPATKERAAIADRHVSKDRSIYDSSVIRPKEKSVKKARKKTSCKRRGTH